MQRNAYNGRSPYAGCPTARPVRNRSSIGSGRRDHSRPLDPVRPISNSDGLGYSCNRPDLAQVIRKEVRQAVADASPEARRAQEEAIAEAQVLDSPENQAAYQSASDMVTTAVAAKRWTEEDKETSVPRSVG